MWKCELCNIDFDDVTKFAGHRSGHVRRGELLKKPTKTYDCKFCDRVFENGHQLRGHSVSHTRTVEDVTCYGTKKKYLLLELGHKCQVCDNSEWMGKPIPIEIDHIDGNPENNDKTNLRLICPNCHAQTDTYRGKNVGKVENSRRKEKLKKHYGKYR